MKKSQSCAVFIAKSKRHFLTIVQGKIILSLIASIGLFIVFKSGANAQDLDVPYVPTPSIVVEKMLDLADIKPGDYLIDLGSGDGRIVIAAAKRGAIGHGVDIDPQRIEEANKNAVDAGVDDSVLFVNDDIFNVDFSKADIITMYLLHSINIKLRPALLKKLRPGTRIISHDFDMDDWAYDDYIYLEESSVYKWVIPANVQGNWKWQNGTETFIITIQQEYQNIKVTINSEKNSLIVHKNRLSGDKITLEADNPQNGNHYLFNGRVNGKIIDGTIQIRNGSNRNIETWIARHML